MRTHCTLVENEVARDRHSYWREVGWVMGRMEVKLAAAEQRVAECAERLTEARAAHEATQAKSPTNVSYVVADLLKSPM